MATVNAAAHQTLVINHVTNNSSGTGRTRLQIAAGTGVAGPLADEACELAVAAGTLERVEGGTLGVRYALPHKGV